MALNKNLTEIYYSDIYKNHKNDTETLTLTELDKNNVSLFLQVKGYNVMCETTFSAQRLAEVKPQILHTVIENGDYLTFNCDIDWNTFISSNYNTLTLNYDGVVADWERSTVIKDIWHVIGLTENLEEYTEEDFDNLCDSIFQNVLNTYTDSGIDMLLDRDGVSYNWLKNLVCKIYYDEISRTVKATYHLKQEFYKALYNYIYDNYAVSGEITYTLHTQATTGTYSVDTPVRLTKDLFRKAFLEVGNSYIDRAKYNWFLPDSDTIYETYVKPILDVYHYDNLYDYVNIMFGVSEQNYASTGYCVPDKVQLLFYNLNDGAFTVTRGASGYNTDLASSRDNTSVKVLSWYINYTVVNSSHQCGTEQRIYTKNIDTYTLSTEYDTQVTNRKINTSAFLYSTGDSLPTSTFYWESGGYVGGTFKRFGLCSCRFTESGGVDNHFIQWTEPRQWTPRTTDNVPVNIEPKPDDEPEPDEDTPTDKEPKPVPRPVVKLITPDEPIPPEIVPEHIEGIVPVRTTPSHKYNGMTRTWYTGEDEMDAVNGILWQEGVIETLKGIFQNSPLDSILRFSELYAMPVEEINYTESGNIILGTVDCGDDSASNIIDNPYIEMILGQVQIPKYFNDFRDYSPYSTMKIYLPFVSWNNLNINDFVGHDLKLTATVNIITGELVYHVLRVDSLTEIELNTFNGNCSNTLPVSANDRTALITGLIGTICSLSYGNVIGGVGSLASSKQNVATTGTLTGNIGAMCNKVPYVIVTRPCNYDDEEMYTILGDTTNIVCSLGSLKGFIKCKDIKLDGLNAPDEIKEYITDLCKNGVHVK